MTLMGCLNLTKSHNVMLRHCLPGVPLRYEFQRRLPTGLPPLYISQGVFFITLSIGLSVGDMAIMPKSDVIFTEESILLFGLVLGEGGP